MSGVSQSGGESVAIKPARFWYVVAAALFVGSLIPAFFLARSGIDKIDLSVDLLTGNTIEVHEDEQLSIFAPAHFSLPELLNCTVTPSGGQPVPLDSSANELSFDGHERVGLTPEGLPEGTYQLRCQDGRSLVPLDGFGVRSTEGWTQAILMIVAAAVIPGVAGLTAITIAVVTAVQRSSARRRLLRPPPPYSPAGYPPPPPPAGRP
jgi:hypothetical protein